ncbi:MAG: amidase [Alphaproteobacteria bacterium]|jgi:Asp-tRNA(Asn)/Glu-tRNA(Gln) amidotransferase A subunit family amidase
MSQPGITADTIAAAEPLAGIEFSAAERTQILAKIDEKIDWLRACRRFVPENGLGPATVFDPRLPGMDILPQDGGFTPSDAPPPPLPEQDIDIAFAPLTTLAGWLREGAITSSRLTALYLERIERIGPTLECTVTVTRDLAIAQAAEADREIAAGLYRGPLHGIPWGAKDLLDTAGIATTWGAAPYRDRMPTRDAAVVRRLHDAGAVLIAKTTLGALAFGDIWFGGRTRNPWHIDEGASGSSAGSASATAAGLVGFAIGTETLGSIVSPCERCGVTGLRPTFGRVSRAGAMALSWSLDKIGPICRAVEDSALVLDTLNGYDAADPGSIDMPFAYHAGRSVKGLRLGYSPAWFEGDQATDVDRAALSAAQAIGLELVEITLPDLPYDSLMTILDADCAAAFEELTLSGRDDLLVRQDDEAWPNLFRTAHLIPAVAYVQVERLRRAVMIAMADVFQGIDAMIGSTPEGAMLTITNFTGQPSLTLPAGFLERPLLGDGTLSRDAPSKSGPKHRMPQGITLWGRLFDEDTLCAIGMALEAHFNLANQRPPTG